MVSRKTLDTGISLFAFWLNFSTERVTDPHGAVLLTVIQVLAVERLRAQSFRGSNDRTVPVGKPVAQAGFDGNLDQTRIDWKAGEHFELFNPFHGFIRRQWNLYLSDHRDVKFLKHLHRQAEILLLDQVQGSLAFCLRSTAPGCGIDEDIRVNETLNGHAALHGSMTGSPSVPSTGCSAAGFAAARFVPG